MGIENCIPNFWEREWEAGIPGNGREREFPLTPVASYMDDDHDDCIVHGLWINILFYFFGRGYDAQFQLVGVPEHWAVAS